MADADLDADARAGLLAALVRHLAAARQACGLAPDGAAPTLDPEHPVHPEVALALAAAGLEAGQVHPNSPRYLGLLLPAPAAVAVAAEALVAAYDPQLATRGHAPWPVAVEEQTLAALARALGFPSARATFTTGGAEANLVAVVTALVDAHPEVARRGVRGLAAAPTIYASDEAHPTVVRAARIAGLGADAVRVVPTDAAHRMKVDALRATLARDRASGAAPLLVVATAGTTSVGAFDPIGPIVAVARAAGARVHVDGAYGGFAGLLPELEGHLAGLGDVDTLTFDPHKVLAVPLGAGAFFTRHPGSLSAAFGARGGYMPRGGDDPYAESPRWSRRFAGLATHLVLGTLGWEGVRAHLRAQLALAARLADRLRVHGFRVLFDGPLPVVCFVDGAPGGDRGGHLEGLRRAAIAEGAGWTTLVRFAHGGRALRACITNHRTGAPDVDAFVAALAAARARPR